MPRILLAAGLLLAPALPLHASVESTLSFDVKVHTQAKFSRSGPKEYGSVRIVRVDSKQLLRLVSDRLSLKLPKGAQLRVLPNGKVLVTDSNGSLVRDVSAYFKANYAKKHRLFDGSLNTETGQEGTRSYMPVSIVIKLPTLSGTVRGMVEEHLEISEPDRDGIQISDGYMEGEVNGRGKADGKKALFDGSIILKGRKATVVR